MKFIFKKNLSPQAGKGFTIIELAISIFVLSIAVVGIFSAFSMITILTANTSDKLTAAYLAQEGMEIVRNVRDINWLLIDNDNDPINSPLKWTDGIGGCGVANPCQADYKTVPPQLDQLTDYLYIDSNGFYTQTPGANDKITKFKRKIVIECFPSGNSSCVDGDYMIKVKVEVAWDQKANILTLNSCGNDACKADTALDSDCENNNEDKRDNCVKVEETLYNWYKYNPPSQE